MNTINYNSDFKDSYIPHILKEIYIDKVYEPFFHGKKDLVVIDIGANIGLFSMYVSKYAKKIIAVEPSETHRPALMLNTCSTQENIVKVLPYAISKENGLAKFYHSSNVTMYSLKQEVNNKPDEVEEVEMITMERLFEMENLDYVDFLKLDCEGVETEIICSSAFEKIAPKIKTMTVEWHSWSNTNPSQLVNALHDYGFKVTQIPNDATLFYAER